MHLVSDVAGLFGTQTKRVVTPLFGVVLVVLDHFVLTQNHK